MVTLTQKLGFLVLGTEMDKFSFALEGPPFSREIRDCILISKQGAGSRKVQMASVLAPPISPNMAVLLGSPILWVVILGQVLSPLVLKRTA